MICFYASIVYMCTWRFQFQFYDEEDFFYNFFLCYKTSSLKKIETAIKNWKQLRYFVWLLVCCNFIYIMFYAVCSKWYLYDLDLVLFKIRKKNMKYIFFLMYHNIKIMKIFICSVTISIYWNFISYNLFVYVAKKISSASIYYWNEWFFMFFKIIFRAIFIAHLWVNVTWILKMIDNEREKFYSIKQYLCFNFNYYECNFWFWSVEKIEFMVFIQKYLESCMELVFDHYRNHK